MTDTLRLLLVEDELHVEDMLARGWGEGCHPWIALGPSAMVALDSRRIAYSIPEDFHSWADLTVLCADLHNRVERLCDELDERLLTLRPELARQATRPFRFYIFPLMILFDSVGSRIYQLRRVLEAYPT